MSDNKRFNLDDDVPSPAPEQEAQSQEPSAEDYASPERYENDKVRLIDFLQYPREKTQGDGFPAGHL